MSGPLKTRRKAQNTIEESSVNPTMSANRTETLLIGLTASCRNEDQSRRPWAMTSTFSCTLRGRIDRRNLRGHDECKCFVITCIYVYMYICFCIYIYIYRYMYILYVQLKTRIHTRDRFTLWPHFQLSNTHTFLMSPSLASLAPVS